MSIFTFVQGEEEELEVCSVYYMPAYAGLRAALTGKWLLGQGCSLNSPEQFGQRAPGFPCRASSAGTAQVSHVVHGGERGKQGLP